jgi:uncharacterized protein with PQ loop repeat
MSCVCIDSFTGTSENKHGERFNQFVGSYFSDCVYSNVELASFGIGLSSIGVWLFCQSPQIYENYKLGRAESLSVVFLLIWLTGDITNLAGCILTNQLPTQKYTAMFFVCIDTVMMSQYSYYRFVKPFCFPVDDEDFGEESGGISVSFRNENSTGKHSVVLKTVDLEANNAGGRTRQLSEGSIKSRKEEDAKPAGKGRVLAAAVVLVPLLGFPSLLSFRNTLVSSRGRDLQGHTHFRSTGRVLLGLQEEEFSNSTATPYGTVAYDWGVALATVVGKTTRTTTDFQYELQVREDVADEPTICNAAPDISNVAESIGDALSWISSALYFLSRIPQVYHNYTRRSVEGLSVIMFISAVLGNLTYGIAIIMRLEDKADLMSKLPFLIGSIGTLCFDATIISQFFIYGDGSDDDDGFAKGSKDWLLGGADEEYAELDNEVDTREVDLDSSQSRTRPQEIPPSHAVSAPLQASNARRGSASARRNGSRPLTSRDGSPSKSAARSFSARASGALQQLLEQRMPVPYISTINPTPRPRTFSYGRSNSFSGTNSPSMNGLAQRQRPRSNSIDSPEMGVLSLSRTSGRQGK